ncbi:MAG: cadmium-translocating P-type ATPase [Clostridia bacterium]|nr:cadmium-translocating P-type ATPase [Clostridia bacterium]
MKIKLNYNYFAICLSIVFLCIGLFVPFTSEYFNIAFYLISYLLVGAKVLYRVVHNFAHKNFFDENTLMGVASIGALCIGEYTEAVLVMLLYSIGMLLQSKAVNKSRRSIAELMNIQAEYAYVVVDGEPVKKEIYDIKKGDLLLIKAGEKVAVDAVIIEGESSLDTSSITGESTPKYVTVGDSIISGSINKDGIIYAKATTEYYDSTVSKILELVEDATSRKSNCEQFITKFAKYYTPVVCIISLLIFLIPVILGWDTMEWLKKALIFLVVSCPCALVISVPLSFFGGIGGLSRRGVLIKGSNYLEALAKTKVVAFDKTGTLTNGEFEVKGIKPYGISKNDFINYVFSLEKYSNHILGKAIIKYCKNAEKEGKIKELFATNVKEIPGYGIVGNINGSQVLAGSSKMLNDKTIKFQKAEESGTVIYLAKDSICLGYVVLVDKIKDKALETINELKSLGIEKTILLSGDRKDVVTEIGTKLGFNECHGELLPNQKVEKMTELITEQKGKVAFVGDGVNDAPVLTLSDIGISMGGFGVDSAKEASDIVIMNDEIEKIPKAIKSSKKIMRIIMQNITFALCIKFAILILDVLGYATMGMAVFADVGVTILAIFNSLRTLKA